MKEKYYTISEESYVNTVAERVLLYSFIRQIAFEVRKADRDSIPTHLRETSQNFDYVAEKMFDSWNIPGRYCVYGDAADLDGIKEKELLLCDEDDADSFDPEADGDDEPSFFDAMANLIERSRELADEMETAVAKLDAVFEPFRHYDE